MKPCAFPRPAAVLRVAFALAIGACTSACAGSIEDESTLPTYGDSADGERIEELETRIAELERDLSRAQRTPTESVVVTPEPTPLVESDSLLATAESFRAPDTDATLEPSDGSGPRTVLRLHESRPTTVEVPVVTERLPVVEIPAVSNPANVTPRVAAPAVTSAAAVAQVPAASGTLPVVDSNAAVLPIVGTLPQVATATSPAPAPAPTDDLTEYRAGLAHLTSRRYQAAVASLSAFLRDHPGGEHSDDALYWRATAQYALRNYREALVDYERVVRVAPRGERAADSLYHSGLCHRRLGDSTRAANAFARLRREYPNSVAARLALREDTT